MAAAAAAVDPSLEAAFQASCEAVAGLSVAVLDEKQAERDWHRWMQAIMDELHTAAGRPGSSRPDDVATSTGVSGCVRYTSYEICDLTGSLDAPPRLLFTVLST